VPGGSICIGRGDALLPVQLSPWGLSAQVLLLLLLTMVKVVMAARVAGGCCCG